MSELDKEHPEADDQAVFEEIVALTRQEMREDDRGNLLRGQHAKPTGCAEAEVIVGADLPADLRFGVFERPGAVFKALVRFSNNSKVLTEPDQKGRARGVAIKLLDVEGERAIPGPSDRSQDFLMINHPVFPFPDPAAYLTAVRDLAIGDKIGDLVAAVHLAFKDWDALRAVLEIKRETVANPLEIIYWSGTPYWLGAADGSVGGAVKYSLVPRSAPADRPVDPDRDENYLRAAFVDHLTQREAVFDLKIQRQGEGMPIEDAQVWDEKISVPVAVATVRIPRQGNELIAEATGRCDKLSFNPWNARHPTGRWVG
jgi:hypothetical protein